MVKKSDSSDNWECQRDGTEHENQIITFNYNIDSALLNVSSNSSNTFTANLPPNNFYFVPIKTINPFEGYRQKLTKPKKSQYSRLGWF